MRTKLTAEQKAYAEMTDDFAPEVVAMFKRLRAKLPRFSLSYRTYSSSYLLDRLRAEVRVLAGDFTEENAIDVANFAVMIAYRIRQQKGES